MIMPQRENPDGDYRFRFQGQEKEDEVYGEGFAYDFGARIYDSRLCRWFSRDKLAWKYPYHSPYVFTANNPNLFRDFDGNDYEITVTDGVSGANGTITISATLYTTSIEVKRAEDIQSFYKAENGKYMFVDVKGNKYDIVFDIAIDATSSTSEQARSKGQKDIKGNSFLIDDEFFLHGSRDGTTGESFGNETFVRNASKTEQILNSDTKLDGVTIQQSDSHEILHLFGISVRLLDIGYKNPDTKEANTKNVISLNEKLIGIILDYSHSKISVEGVKGKHKESGPLAPNADAKNSNGDSLSELNGKVIVTPKP